MYLHVCARVCVHVCVQLLTRVGAHVLSGMYGDQRTTSGTHLAFYHSWDKFSCHCYCDVYSRLADLWASRGFSCLHLELHHPSIEIRHVVFCLPFTWVLRLQTRVIRLAQRAPGPAEPCPCSVTPLYNLSHSNRCAVTVPCSVDVTNIMSPKTEHYDLSGRHAPCQSGHVDWQWFSYLLHIYWFFFCLIVQLTLRNNFWEFFAITVDF